MLLWVESEMPSKSHTSGRKRLSQFSRKYDGALASLLGKASVDAPRRSRDSEAPQPVSPPKDIMDGYEFPDAEPLKSASESPQKNAHSAEPSDDQKPRPDRSTEVSNNSATLGAFSMDEHDYEDPENFDFGQPDTGASRFLSVVLGALAVIFGLITLGLTTEVGVFAPVVGLCWAVGGFGLIGGSKRGAHGRWRGLPRCGY